MTEESKDFDEPCERWLYVDTSKESRLAEKYLHQSSLSFHIMNLVADSNEQAEIELRSSSQWFANTFREPVIPMLIFDSPRYGPRISYPSFSGVKAYLREKISLRVFKKIRPFWFDVSTFYSYDGEHKITCFDEEGQRMYEGALTKSPYPLEKFLDEHDFKSWHEVSFRKIKPLASFIKENQENPLCIDQKSHTLLFPDEIPILQKGKKIVVQDSRCYMQVLYQAYVPWEGDVYGIYANMID